MTDEPTALDGRTYATASTGQRTGLASRLERRFGLGAMPDKRRALYVRLELLVAGDARIELLIREAAAEALGKDNPDRYFCRAVVLKLREANVYPQL